MKAYKILQVLPDGDLASFVYAPYLDKYTPGYGIKYNKEGETRPKIGSLFVFRWITDAMRFYLQQGVPNGHVIYEVECKNTSYASDMAQSSAPDDVQDFWDGTIEGVKAPEGTYYTDSITLVKKVAEFY